jgi:hypothetical protein
MPEKSITGKNWKINVPQLTEVAAKTKLQFINQGLIAAILVRCCYKL